MKYNILKTLTILIAIYIFIGIRIGAVRVNAPYKKVWRHFPQTLPSSYYQYIKYYYIATT